jgi:N-acetylneuraminic acid mutarotase
MRIRIGFSVFLSAVVAGGMLAGCTSGNQPMTNPNPSPTQEKPPNSPYTAGVGQWTWIGGSSTANPAGSWGTVGQTGAGNVPSGRQGAVSWKDAAGNFWLFGGEAENVGASCSQYSALCNGGTNAWYNDLWEFSHGAWTWVAGSSSTDQPGVYGTLGAASAGNVPGARWGAVSWTDAQGNFWLFGGTGYDSTGNTGVLNDLWEYSAGEWTWMGGAKVVNQPGTYGTQGTPATGNFPGARTGAVAVADASGHVWLFGGQGCDSTPDCGAALNDLWEYSGGQWTWISGATVAYPAVAGVFGTQGTPAAANHPGGRWNPAGWIDAAGNVWIFGGVGYNTYDLNVGDLNDLWRFSGGQWTWMGGSSSDVDAYGTLGTEGSPAEANMPGSSYSGMTWTDALGNLWFFGGQGFSSASNSGDLNDLWKYSGGEWTWMTGSSVGWQWGYYGTQGVPGTTVPGSRLNGVTWADAQGNLWLFGGYGLDANGNLGDLNDLWEYQP